LIQYNTRCNPQRRDGNAYLWELEEVEGEVEDGVEGKVKDAHNPFEDLKEKLKIQQ